MTFNHLRMLSDLSILMTRGLSYIHPLGMVSDSKKLGFMLGTDNSKFRIILGQEFNATIYRGQNASHERFLPSFQRINFHEAAFEHCKNWIKREEFKRQFIETPYFKRLSTMNVLGSTFDFDLDAIAQHYEFATDYLDITTNINIAMFFAYTYVEDGRYVPITDFKKYHPKLYTANFSIINPEAVKIVGFQSVLRPKNQMAMAIDMSKITNDKTLGFHEIDLPEEPEMARGIFNSFKGGSNLFPDEPMAFFQQQIRSKKTFDKEIFMDYCKCYKKDENELEDLVIQNEFSLKEESWEISEDIKRAIDIEITNFILPWIENNISFRGTCESA